jgi:predicted dehydrogenase
MKTRLLLIGSLVACLLTVSVPAFAHHAWHGYDMANVTTVKGTVTQFDWGNPHVWISLEVQGDKGGIEKWSAGGPSPSRMAGTGWDKETLKPGDQITAVGHRISDGTYSLRLVKVVLSDGRELICYGGR